MSRSGSDKPDPSPPRKPEKPTLPHSGRDEPESKPAIKPEKPTHSGSGRSNKKPPRSPDKPTMPHSGSDKPDPNPPRKPPTMPQSGSGKPESKPTIKTEKPPASHSGSDRPRPSPPVKTEKPTMPRSGYDKSNFRDPNLGSPVSHLRTGVGPSTSSSSSSSGSASSRTGSTRRAEAEKRRYSAGSASSSPHGVPGSHSGASSAPVIYRPAGNICPSGVVKTGMASGPPRSTVLASGPRNYGYGSIVWDRGRGRGSSSTEAPVAADPEELKRLGNERYKIGDFSEAVRYYDRAMAISPNNAVFRFNKGMALTGLRRFEEAVSEFEEAIRLDGNYVKAHQRLGSLFTRLGQVENARRHLCSPGHHPDPDEMRKIQAVEANLVKCNHARAMGDWKRVLTECDAVVAAGADSCPQIHACKAEAFLKLRRLEEANTSISKVPECEHPNSPSSQSKFFGMLSVAYLFTVRAQIEMALGRFENAVSLAEKAGAIDPRNIEIALLVSSVRQASGARTRGNGLFKSGKYAEACTAYGQGLLIDPSNSVFYCNRAACWFKLGKWEHSVDDCTQALILQPNYTKALFRRADANSKLERWARAVQDYEALRMELPHNNEVAEKFFHAQIALKTSRGEEVSNMKFGGEVEIVSGLDLFKVAISFPGVSVVYFKTAKDSQCEKISPIIDTLCVRYPTINFLKVDVEQSREIATAEYVRIVPTFKIYRNGKRVKEMVRPSPEVLESSVRHYSL